MAGKYDVSELKKIAASLAKSTSCVVAVVKGGGIFALVGLVDVVKTVMTIDWTDFKAEIGEVDAAEKLEIKVEFEANLTVADAALKAKILSVESCVEDTAGIAEEVVDVVQKGVAVVAKIKALFA